MARANQRFRNRNHNNLHSSGRGYNRTSGPSNQGWESYASDEDNSESINPNPFLRESRPNTRIRKNHRNSENTIIQPQRPTDHHSFLVRSQRIKENLKRYLSQALAEIERWFPEETMEAGGMDWQPEDEVVIPQIDRSVIYSYGFSDKPRSEPSSNVAGFKVGSSGVDRDGNCTITPRAPSGDTAKREDGGWNPCTMGVTVVGSFGQGSRGNDWTTPSITSGFGLRAGSALLDVQIPPPTPLASIK